MRGHEPKLELPHRSSTDYSGELNFSGKFDFSETVESANVVRGMWSFDSILGTMSNRNRTAEENDLRFW